MKLLFLITPNPPLHGRMVGTRTRPHDQVKCSLRQNRRKQHGHIQAGALLALELDPVFLHLSFLI